MPKKKKQTGGLLRGKSHDNGGIPAIVAGKKPIEMEGGEFVSSVSATDAFGKDNYAYINDLGNRDPAAAKKLGKEIKKMAKHGGSIKKYKNGGEIEEIARQMGYGGEIEKYGLGSWLKKKVTPSKKVQRKVAKHITPSKRLKKAFTPSKKAKSFMKGAWKRTKGALDVGGAHERMKTGMEKAENLFEQKASSVWGLKEPTTDQGFETDEKYAERKDKERTDEYSGRAGKARSTDAYLKALSRTSRGKRGGQRNFGATGSDLGRIIKTGELEDWTGQTYREGGSVMDQSEISEHYATEDYKAGGCAVTGGTAGDPVAIYNNKKG